ncbi:MAG TPA: hypothetical protein ENH55_13195 [Aurantimonas coralicida]|uniref:Uncharacterized protein n=2 Tax=root TaxID=1 RepID=A0A9C9TFU5_9HYPH|nr:hypothetical protein [Aurantimonas coralicida]HET99611.1 hypothetical protein [Aurantimonas coralicida]
MITVRPATRADFVDFYGTAPPMTVRALAAESTAGEVLGIGGYYLSDGVVLAFTDYHEAMSKRDRVKGAHALVAMLRELGIEVVAHMGEDGATALKHFGFEAWGMFWRMK